MKSEAKTVSALEMENAGLKARLADQEARLAKIEKSERAQQRTLSEAARSPALGTLLLLSGGVGGGLLLRRLA